MDADIDRRFQALEAKAQRAQSSASSALGGGGVRSSSFTSSAAVILNGQLVKASGVGTVEPLGAADRPSIALGPALDGVGLNERVAVAQPGQPVTMLNDGAGVLAVGDHVVPTADAGHPGRVVLTAAVPGNPMLGIVLVGCAAVANAPVVVWYSPGII